MTELQLGDIQGLLLRAYGMPVAAYHFYEITDAGAARSRLREIADHVTTAAPWRDKPASTINVAMTYRGLARLGLPAGSLAGFAEPFRAGMAASADRIGDTGDSAPAHWEEEFRTGRGQVMILINAVDVTELARRERWLDAVLSGGGLTGVARQQAGALPMGREHFGYAGGASQPIVEGAVPTRAGQPGHRGGSRWWPIRAGEFIFGYPDEENALPPVPAPDRFGRNGSFLVYRKLHQRVATFRALVREAGARYPGGGDQLAAKLMGRWPDGSPLSLTPDRGDRAMADCNDFNYHEDPQGLRCPLGAHIRRANPRDSLPFDGKLVNRHRIIRRGQSYGPVLPAGAPDDGEDRGMIFICFNTDIARQFEFIQSQWLNDGNAFGLGSDKDPFLGDHTGTGKMTVQGRPPHFVSALPRLVTVRGGEYYFLPGIRALHHLTLNG